MTFKCLTILLTLVVICGCEVNIGIYNEPTDYVLCRHCGADIGNSNYFVLRLSPSAFLKTNQSLFKTSDVAVQSLKNPLGVEFQVVTLSKASCHAYDKWHVEHSWFPGYAWKICVCGQCRHHLGWVFEPIASADEERNAPSENGFYALILDNILSEECNFQLSSCSILPQMACIMDLSDEQKKFINACEEEFDDRFTDKDEEYVSERDTELPTPPIVEPWYNKSRRNFDFSRRGRDHDRGRRDAGRFRNSGDDRGRDHDRDRNRDRDRDRSGDFSRERRDHRNFGRREFQTERERDRYGRTNYRQNNQW